MPLQTHLTIGEISATFDVAEWRVRRAVDSLDAEVPRIGRYRAVPRALLGQIAIELQRRGWLPSEKETADVN